MKSLTQFLCLIVLCSLVLSLTPADDARAEPAGSRNDSDNRNNRGQQNQRANIAPAPDVAPPPLPENQGPILDVPEAAPTAPAPGGTGVQNFGKFENNPFNPDGSDKKPNDDQSEEIAPESNVGPGQAGSNNYKSFNNSPFNQDSPLRARWGYTRKPIVIQCPEWCDGTCRYALISASGRRYTYTISPGQKQEFLDTSQWRVRYIRGQGQGYRTYRLRGGYEYKLYKDDDGELAFFRAASP